VINIDSNEADKVDGWQSFGTKDMIRRFEYILLNEVEKEKL